MVWRTPGTTCLCGPYAAPASSPTRCSAAAAGRPRCWPKWRPPVPEPPVPEPPVPEPPVPEPPVPQPSVRRPGAADPLTELLARATERSELAEVPGKSGATLERVVIDGQHYVLKHIDLADDWTMRASGCLRGAPLVLWERGILARLPGCLNQPIVGAAPTRRGCALLMRDVTPWLVPATDAPITPGQHAGF